MLELSIFKYKVLFVIPAKVADPDAGRAGIQGLDPPVSSTGQAKVKPGMTTRERKQNEPHHR